jgi:transcriptional regulator with XRE-family HTH domain
MAEDDNFELELIEEQAVAHIQAMVLRLLDEKKMSRQDLATAIGVSAPRVSQLLGDEPENLSIKMAARLFYGLGETLTMTCETIERLNRDAEARNARAHAACHRQVRGSTPQAAQVGSRAATLSRAHTWIAAGREIGRCSEDCSETQTPTRPDYERHPREPGS